MKVVTIGRSQENDYVINEPGVSKYNTQIIKTDDGRFLIVDMGSVNGTFVNGRKISGEYPLKSGDTVIVANVSLDWQSLFAVENPSPVHSVPQKKARGGWILALILGAVVAVLITCFVVYMYFLKKQKEEEVKMIDTLSKEKAEYQEKARSTKEDNLVKDADIEAYEDALSKLLDENAKQNVETASTKKKLEEAKVTADKLKADKDKTLEELEEAEKKYNELLEESKAKQKILNDQIGLSEKSVADLKAQQDTLTKQLREAEDALQQAQDTYVKRMEELREFMKQLEEAKVKDITASMICDALKYDYVGKDPEDVLYEKFKEGHGNEIRLKIKGMIQVFGNKQQ